MEVRNGLTQGLPLGLSLTMRNLVSENINGVWHVKSGLIVGVSVMKPGAALYPTRCWLGSQKFSELDKEAQRLYLSYNKPAPVPIKAKPVSYHVGASSSSSSGKRDRTQWLAILRKTGETLASMRLWAKPEFMEEARKGGIPPV
jgi:hypothetical protein